MQALSSQTASNALHCGHGEGLRPVLSDRARARPRRRAVVTARRPRADARPEALHRPRRDPAGSGPTSSRRDCATSRQAASSTKRTLPPPAASRVYELTDYGRELRSAMRELAVWGARSLGPPPAHGELFPGWLDNAIDSVLAPVAPPGRFEFRVGDEIASLVDGEARPGAVEAPDVVVEGDPAGPLPPVRRPAGRSRHGSGRPRPAATAARRCTRTRRGDGRSLVLTQLGETQARSVPAEAPATPTTSKGDQRPGRNLRRRVHGTGMTVMWGRASPSGRSPRAAARAASPAQRTCS